MFSRASNPALPLQKDIVLAPSAFDGNIKGSNLDDKIHPPDPLTTGWPSPLSRVWDSLNLLRLEVQTLVREVHGAVMGTGKDLDRALAREDYIDNLESQIDNDIFELVRSQGVEANDIALLRGVQTIAVNLERIADFAINILGQLQYLAEPHVLVGLGPDPFFDLVEQTLEVLQRALVERDLRAGLEICRSEFRIDELYREVFVEIMARLRAGQHPEDLVTSLFVFRYLERMGDSLLNAGEAVLFSAVGEKIKISHYEALRQTLEHSNAGLEIDSLAYEGIWGTRSGARIGCVHGKGASKTRWVIFKEGQTRKIREEKQGLERWAAILPDLPPRIVGFHEHGNHASLLLEYLQGQTLQHIVLERDANELGQALNLLFPMLFRIWQSTLEAQACRPGFVAQVRSRIHDVFKLHPGHDTPTLRMGALHVPAFREILQQAEVLDDVLSSPFCVLLHGDFNLDNLMIDLENSTIRLIDLHRTHMGDYMQDASVFLVSNFRIPLLDSAVRGRLNAVGAAFFGFIRDFARAQGDATWAARLALGLARSFLTSTRFVVNASLAAAMHKRGRFLLESLLAHPRHDFASYQLDVTVIEY